MIYVHLIIVICLVVTGGWVISLNKERNFTKRSKVPLNPWNRQHTLAAFRVPKSMDAYVGSFAVTIARKRTS